MGIGSVLLVTFVIIVGVMIMVGFIGYGIYLNYLYERDIGGYMETARDTITPESFKEQLILFKDAVNRSGITENDYGAMWFKKQDNSMKFQIQHVDSIIGRADAMMLWQQASYNNTGVQPVYASPEAFRDVYNEKMNNLRDYIHAEGYRSDWIVEDAWYVKYHPVMYFQGWIVGITFGIIVLVIALTGLVNSHDF